MFAPVAQTRYPELRIMKLFNAPWGNAPWIVSAFVTALLITVFAFAFTQRTIVVTPELPEQFVRELPTHIGRS